MGSTAKYVARVSAAVFGLFTLGLVVTVMSPFQLLFWLSKGAFKKIKNFISDPDVEPESSDATEHGDSQRSGRTSAAAVGVPAGDAYPSPVRAATPTAPPLTPVDQGRELPGYPHPPPSYDVATGQAGQ